MKLIVQNRRFLVLTSKGRSPNLASQARGGAALAEIYAAISQALSNLEQITGEIEREDHLSAQASRATAPFAA